MGSLRVIVFTCTHQTPNYVSNIPIRTAKLKKHVAHCCFGLPRFRPVLHVFGPTECDLQISLRIISFCGNVVIEQGGSRWIKVVQVIGSRWFKVDQVPGKCAVVAQVCPTSFLDELHRGPRDFFFARVLCSLLALRAQALALSVDLGEAAIAADVRAVTAADMDFLDFAHFFFLALICS